jgi:hypothetical protein
LIRKKEKGKRKKEKGKIKSACETKILCKNILVLNFKLK